jgi:predicted transcriptional regulator
MDDTPPTVGVTDEQIIQVFLNAADPVLSTTEVAEELPLERRAVFQELVELSQEGRLDGKQIGDNNVVWWRPGFEE